MQDSFVNLLKQGMAEDDWTLDWTTRGSVDARKKIRAQIIAKESGVWAADGLCEATERVARDQGLELKCRAKIAQGEEFKKAQFLVEWDGNARILLALERPFLNLASYLSGIATQTQKMVQAVRKGSSDIRVTSTRKILPGYRDLVVQAVMAGGGHSHRVSLSGGVLIKENHIASAGGIERAVNGARAVAPHGLKIEIEVRSLDELKQALDCGVDAVLLDNFSPDQVGAAVEKIKKFAHPVTVEVSGGVTAENAAQYALPGVHVLSSGGLTHSVRAIDLSLLVEQSS